MKTLSHWSKVYRTLLEKYPASKRGGRSSREKVYDELIRQCIIDIDDPTLKVALQAMERRRKGV